MMYYLHINYDDNQVEYFCSKDVRLLLEMVVNQKNWTIGDMPLEFPPEDYLEFEVTVDCQPIIGRMN